MIVRDSYLFFLVIYTPAKMVIHRSNHESYFIMELYFRKLVVVSSFAFELLCLLSPKFQVGLGDGTTLHGFQKAYPPHLIIQLSYGKPLKRLSHKFQFTIIVLCSLLNFNIYFVSQKNVCIL